ncbi:hypothetical protein OIU76_022914 [Salix suchowensis]|nr:hypothetical protein OIU76_022914 [Salix suchowensis]
MSSTHLRQRIQCSSSSVREQARGHRGYVQGPTPHQLMGFPESEIFDPKAQSGETLETQELTNVEAMDIDTGSADIDCKRVSELYFMRKLLMKEMGDDGNSYKFLDIAVHAVFIESGFGGINFISGKVDGFHLTEEQASKNLAMSYATRSWNF